MDCVTEWKPVNVETLNTPRSEKIKGVVVTVYFGTDDMPTAVKGAHNKDREVFTINLRYGNDDETKQRKRFDNNTVLRVGSKSGRLYEIELDVQKLGANAVSLVTHRIEDLLGDLPQKAEHLGMSRLENYKAVLKAFSQVRPEIESSLR